MSEQRRFIVRSPQDLGRAIGELRRGAGYTQEQLAERAGISRAWLAQLERGRPSRSLTVMIRLLRRLGGDLIVVAPATTKTDS